MKRRHPNAETKIACLLHRVWELQGDAVPWWQQLMLEPWMTCSLVEWDHAVLHTFGGSIHPTNLRARLIADHRHKTAKIDIPAIAKSRRILNGKKKGRPIPGSRNTPFKRKLNGKTEFR